MSHKKDIEPQIITDAQILSVIIKQVTHSDVPATIISKEESRCIYMNSANYQMNSFHKKFNAEGLSRRECPASWAEYADNYEEQDRLAIENKKPISVLSMHEMGKEKKMTNYLSVTRPIFNYVGDVLGLSYEALLVNATLLNRFFITERPAVLNLTPPLEIFTKRELEVIFFTLQGLSAKAIAHRMDLSYRTIENKLQIMYRKVDVINLLQLREYARAFGFQNYIPPRLIRSGVTFL